MKVSVRVKPNARKNEVREVDERTLVVSVTAPPVEGKANVKLVEVLAEYYGKPKRAITILRGTTGRMKVVQID